MLRRVTAKKLLLFYKERNIFVAVNTTAVAIVLSYVFILMRFTTGDALIPLHYDIFFGIDRFGPWNRLLVPVTITLIASMFNFVMAYLLFATNRYASYALTIIASIMSVMLVLQLITLSAYV